MNRREFLKSTAALAALAAMSRLAAQTGVTPTDAKSSEAAKKVARRKFGKTDITLPLLGYGMLRLPAGNDREALQKLVDAAMAAGLNCFDVALRSLPFAGEALKKYPRDSYMVAAAFPDTSSNPSAEDIFKSQLESCQAGHFDFYCAQGAGIEFYDSLRKQKDAGKIKFLGFSFQGSPESLESIVGAHAWDFCRIPLNYVDWTAQNTQRIYDYLTSKEIPVFATDPLQGGALATLNPSALQILKKADENASAASWALRYAASLPNVVTVIDDIAEMERLKDDLNTFTDFKPLTDAERKTLDEARAAYRNVGGEPVPCINCRRCNVCPVRIDIPAVFALWNSFCEKKDEAAFKEAYNQLAAKPSACIGCRRCVRACLKEELYSILKDLSDREERVIRLRYGLDDNRPRTLEEVGREFGVTRERIRQIEAKAIKKLRHPTRSKRLGDYKEKL